MSKIYYVTKYALTNGVEEYPEDQVDGISDTGSLWLKGGIFSYVESGKWFETRAEAEADVRKRAAKKIASLRKQIAKLEKLAAPVSSEKEG